MDGSISIYICTEQLPMNIPYSSPVGLIERARSISRFLGHVRLILCPTHGVIGHFQGFIAYNFKKELQNFIDTDKSPFSSIHIFWFRAESTSDRWIRKLSLSRLQLWYIIY